MQLVQANKEQLKQIKALYKSAFPREERPPFWVLTRNARKGRVEILAIEEDGFGGLVITAQHKDLVLLQFFAVSPEKRGAGIGSKSLSVIRERYPDKRFFLEIETLKEDADNYEERVRRKRFYLRNGMHETSMVVLLFGVELEILTDGSEVSYEEYQELYRQILGKRGLSKIKLCETTLTNDL